MHFIGIEISYAGTRAVALDLDAAVISAEVILPHDWIAGLPDGCSEQNPAQWIDAVSRAVGQCLAALGESKNRVAAIGVAGPQRGWVFLDEANRIVRPAKMSGDVSATKQAEQIARAFGGAPGLIELTGQRPGADSAADCLWLKQTEPYHFQQVVSLMSAQDFIAYWLSGERSTDAGSASATGLFDIRRREWSAELADFIDPGLLRMLPAIALSGQPRGLIRPELARAWGLSEQVQISAGSGAAMLTALSAGCVIPGSIAIELGPQGGIYGVSDEPAVDLRGSISSLCDATGGWLAFAPSSDAAIAAEDFCQHYGWSVEDYEAEVASVPAGADGLYAVPSATGDAPALHGMTRENSAPAHLARAAAEGIALSLAVALERLREMGFEPPEIGLIGADSAGMRQILADVSGLPVVAISSRTGPAVGAAMQAAVAFFQQSGESLGFAEIASYFVTTDAATRCGPDQKAHEFYREMLARWRQVAETAAAEGMI